MLKFPSTKPELIESALEAVMPEVTLPKNRQLSSVVKDQRQLKDWEHGYHVVKKFRSVTGTVDFTLTNEKTQFFKELMFFVSNWYAVMIFGLLNTKLKKIQELKVTSIFCQKFMKSLSHSYVYGPSCQLELLLNIPFLMSIKSTSKKNTGNCRLER